jgi:hypothetical protein
VSAYVKRGTKSGDQWLGRSRRGEWQFTPDKPSRTPFESKKHAERAIEALIKQVIGSPEVVSE